MATKRKAKAVVKRSGGFKQSPAHRSQERFLQRTQVYLMHNIPYFFLNKFGITDKTAQRQRSVSDTTPGFVFALFAPRLEFGWHLEQFIHRLYAFLNVHFWTGSGRTEWVIVFNPIIGTLFAFYGSALIPVCPWWGYCLAYMLPFVWLDGLLWLLIFFVARAVALGIILLIISYFFANMPE